MPPQTFLPTPQDYVSARMEVLVQRILVENVSCFIISEVHGLDSHQTQRKCTM